MKAKVINKFGEPSVFETADLKKAQLKTGEVLIKVCATSVNPVDCKMRAGLFPKNTAPFPAVLHGDVAGIIEEVGPNAKKFKIGDEVFGCAGGVIGCDGALREYMWTDENLLAKKPKTLSMLEAAALPLVSITAWEALFEKARLKAEQAILIHGGTGGVGHIAVQLAKSVGARVCTTISTKEQIKLARALGADDVVIYTEEKVEDYVSRVTHSRGFDIVFDTVGGKNLENSINALGLYGEIVTTNARITMDITPLQKVSGSLHVVYMLIPLLHHVQRQRQGWIMQQISDMAESGEIRPLIDKRIFSLDEISQAHEYLESGKNLGKIAVKIS